MQQSITADKNELFYLNNHGAELTSLCLKLYFDILVQLGLCKSAQEVPGEINKLMQQCALISNQELEQELHARYFAKTQESLILSINDLRHR